MNDRTLCNLLLSLVFMSMAGMLWSQPGEGGCGVSAMIVRTAEKYHYDPRPIDTDFAEDVLTYFTFLLDSDRLLLSQSDVEALLQRRDRLMDDIRLGDCHLVDIATPIYSRGLDRAIDYLEGFKTETFDFHRQGVYRISRGFEEPFEVSTGLQGKWKDHVNTYTLFYYYLLCADGSMVATEDTDSLLQVLKSEVITKELCRLRTLKEKGPNDLEASVRALYLKSVSLGYDPHTEYLSHQDHTDFMTDLTEKSASFGLRFSQDRSGQIVIKAIQAGSPAKSIQGLHEGDVVLEARSRTIGELDLRCSDTNSLNAFISDEDNLTTTFLLRQKGGDLREITLTKELVTVDENAIRSHVLSGKRKVGYIYMPTFYTQVDDVDGFTYGSAHDFAIELISMKSDGIEGLLIDLRQNGGGAMDQAVKIIGNFINFGATGIFDSRDSAPFVLMDNENGTTFDGPLVILVGPMSASASEVVAGAVQAYHRGVIVGSPTFGKSTSQVVMPVDAYAHESVMDGIEGEMGHLKVTVAKIFDINGQSHQLHGIQPDIHLPDVFDDSGVGEKGLPNPLENTDTDKKSYAHKFNALPIDTLIAKSRSRLEKDSVFSLISQVNAAMIAGEMNVLPLAVDEFVPYVRQRMFEMSRFKTSSGSDLDILVPSLRSARLELDSIDLEASEDLRLRMKQDPYIVESYRILDDLINAMSR